jgi:YgiT-type zinc finger domain-containing protein
MTTTRKFEPPTERADYPPLCAVCGGTVVERAVVLSLPEPGGEARIVHHVPAGVCENCGEQYLTSAVVRKLEKLLEAPPTSHQEIPVWDFAASA